MGIPYPAGPRELPIGLTTPNKSYQRGVWLALLALAAFVGMYLGLTGWLGYHTYRFLAGALGGGSNATTGWLAALPTLFLLAFLLKALFFRDKDKNPNDYPVTPEAEPALFEFLHRVADEAGAPRPHKVFLAPDVNAGVFYDVSVLNFFFPSKKNLRIGLGLVNTLTLSEFKAVLAHEFGHFGQRAMAVGAWVYTAQRIAGHIVHKRDIMDRFLMGVSRFDLRIAWIGWIMRTIVWALRSVLDTAFALAVLAERSLTRKMEFQADLVAVSLSGSDAIVHALHKLGPADTAFDEAATVVLSQYHQGRKVGDLYALQTTIIDRLRVILGKADYGVTPALPPSPESHRVFEKRMAAPPRMWSTHPANEDREENAKRLYVPAPLDDRSAWAVFRDPAGLRERMTTFLVEKVAAAPDAPPRPNPDEPLVPVDGQEALAKRYDRPRFDPAYRGAYLGRSVVRVAASASELIPTTLPTPTEWTAPYTDAMVADLACLKAVDEEHDTLLGLRRGLLQAGGGTIRSRGRILRRKDLPAVLNELAAEREGLRRRVAEHDARLRAVHLAAATRIEQGWPQHLRGTLALLHYAEHTAANLEDAAAYFNNVLGIVTADGRVSKGEAERLVAAGMDVFTAIQAVHEQAGQLTLPESVLRRLDATSWKAALPDTFDFSPPSLQNLGSWCGVLGGWIAAYANPLGVLEAATLDHLLENEAQVLRMARGEIPVSPAPESPVSPARYVTLVLGQEREKPWRLGLWDRFMVADGFGPQVARFAVAGGVVFLTLWWAGAVDTVKLALHNGLNRPVSISVGGKRFNLNPRADQIVEIPYRSSIPIEAQTVLGKVIESFTAELPYSLSTYVYNVASADALVRWTAVYGSQNARPERPLGAPRFVATDATVLFRDPPTTMRTKSGEATVAVLSVPTLPPQSMVEMAKTPEERRSMVMAHAVWDLANRRDTALWVHLAGESPQGDLVATQRLAQDERDLLALRLAQDATKGERHAEVCAKHTESARQNPTDMDFAYLAIRCLPDGPAQDQAFFAAHERFPEQPWIAVATAYALAADGKAIEALPILEHHCQNPMLPEYVVMDTARLLRLANRDRDARQLARLSPLLEGYLALESDSTKGGRASPYVALAHGDLERVLRQATDKADRARLVRLVAGSSRAPREAVVEALGLPATDGIDGHTVWPALGLAIREKRPVAEFRKAITKIASPDHFPLLQRCVDAVALSLQPGQMDALLSGLPPQERGHVLVMAIVALGEKAPEAWRDTARKLLFAVERPAI